MLIGIEVDIKDEKEKKITNNRLVSYIPERGFLKFLMINKLFPYKILNLYSINIHIYIHI